MLSDFPRRMRDVNFLVIEDDTETKSYMMGNPENVILDMSPS